MNNYTLLDSITGQQWTSTELYFTRNLRLNCILLRGEEHLGIITRRDMVLFARWCASEMLTRLEGEPDQGATHALSLVDRWLKDQQSVTPEELGDAADAAIRDAWVHARDNEASYEAATRAAALAAEAAWTAARAAWTIAETTIATVVACNAETYISFETQARWLVEHLRTGK